MIKYLSLKDVNAAHAAEIQAAVAAVAESGWYLLGNRVAAFEREYAGYIGTGHCVACANGLDALTLMLRAYIEMGLMAEGDEVIVPANTYIATILSITENRLVPVFVEPCEATFQIDGNLIEQAVTPRTRAVMIVHLYGKCAFTPQIDDICRRHNLLLVEDNAQAHGCTFGGRRTGSLGHAAAHSFYPGKNLGALGDAGAVTTSSAELAEVVRTLANYGSARKYVFNYIGRNSRMDELQAAVLSVKLKYLDAGNSRRSDIARRYIAEIKNERLSVPPPAYLDNNVFHIFPLRCASAADIEAVASRRDRLQAYLADHGVQTMIHYPIPPHRQRCYPQLAHLHLPVTERIHAAELSIPCNQTMTDQEVSTVISLLNAYTGK